MRREPWERRPRNVGITRRRLLAGVAPAAVALYVAACGRGDGNGGAVTAPPESSGPPSGPDGAALVQSGAPPVAFSEVDVQVAESDIRRFLQETEQTHQDYFAIVRDQQGGDAANGQRDAVLGPIQDKVGEAQANGGRVTLRVPIVTLWGAFSFSATAYEGALVVKDPVSMLFYWDAAAPTVYQQSIERLTCRPGTDECRQPHSFQPEDARQGIPGHPFQCHTSPQWVLMGNAGGPLQWVRDVGGLMKTTDRCNRVGRDHIRIFGGPQHPTFRQWCVATPHRERFSWDPLPNKGGHIITSWNGAQHLYAGAWLETGLPNDRPGWDESVFYWDRFDWGNGGTYQKISYDGMGYLIGLRQVT